MKKWDVVMMFVIIVFVGKYIGLGDSYLFVIKVLLYSFIVCDCKFDLLWVEVSDLEEEMKSEDVFKYEVVWESVKKV